jgi:phosphohistidine phosphatase
VKARLYVLQHGDAVSREEDAERPLSSIGRRDIERIAEHLAEKDALIQRIVHSGKLRAEQTAKIISGKLAPDVVLEVVEGISPNDDPKKFIEDIGGVEDTILVASHMPFVSNLCSTLLTGKPNAQFSFTPGTIACVGYAGGQWSLMYMIRPEVL